MFAGVVGRALDDGLHIAPCAARSRTKNDSCKDGSRSRLFSGGLHLSYLASSFLNESFSVSSNLSSPFVSAAVSFGICLSSLALSE